MMVKNKGNKQKPVTKQQNVRQNLNNIKQQLATLFPLIEMELYT